MMSALLPNIPKVPCNKKIRKFKTLNSLNPEPNKIQSMQQSDRKPVKYSPKFSIDGYMITNLDLFSETELKELKDKYILEFKRVKSLIKQIEARELELDQAEDVELRKQGKSKITGQKRVMSMSSERETKRKRLVKTAELNSTETRKVEAVMRKCGGILEKLMKHRHGWVFNKPVDVVALGLSDYHQVVKSPMDLGTVKWKLDKHGYRNPIDFAKDVRLTFDNAMLYNRKGEEVHTMATVLLEMFDKLFDPVHKKFEVEHQGVIVEQQIFGKPLQSKVVSSKQDTEKALQLRPQAAMPKKICIEVDKSSDVSKQKRMVSKAKENPPMKKEMSDCERDQLGLVLQYLAGEYLDEILQIIAKRNSNITTPDGDGEIELDVQALDSETMWDLHRFVWLKLEAEQHTKSIVVTREEDIDIGNEMPINDYPPIVIERDYTPSPVGKVRSNA